MHERGKVAAIEMRGRLRIVGLLAVMIVLVCEGAQATPMITYDLSFGSGAPDKLTGSITTDGTIGPIYGGILRRGRLYGWGRSRSQLVPWTVAHI